MRAFERSSGRGGGGGTRDDGRGLLVPAPIFTRE